MKKSSDTTIRVRFAPSPTGNLHIGGLRAALFNWLFARHNNGVFLLRIEDTDLERSKPEYTDSILQSLEWTGIKSDEPIVIQSRRNAEHQKFIKRLLDEGKAYRCYCTEQEIEERKKSLGDAAEYATYDGHCRNRVSLGDDATKPYAVRFAVPVGPITWDDLIRGIITIESEQVGDFVIARSDSTPIYNLVVVVDDIDMKITHVIRGEEHIANTPKQILLYQACECPVPQFAHLPLILGPSGAKLSKRDAATSVIDYRDAGYLPEALINYLARLGWSHGDQEVFTRDELISYFSLDQVGKSGGIFDQQKLDWLNSTYLRAMTDKALLLYAVGFVDSNLLQKVSRWNEEQILSLVALYKERVKTVLELTVELCALHDGPTTFSSEDIAMWGGAQLPQLLHDLEQCLANLSTYSTDTIRDALKQFSKEHDKKLVAIAQPLRLALVGKTASPGVFELLAILGKEESVRRLQRLAAYIQTHMLV
jgi:glutamyl-tRNA synthetase